MAALTACAARPPPRRHASSPFRRVVVYFAPSTVAAALRGSTELGRRRYARRVRRDGQAPRGHSAGHQRARRIDRVSACTSAGVADRFMSSRPRRRRESTGFIARVSTRYARQRRLYGRGNRRLGIRAVRRRSAAPCEERAFCTAKSEKAKPELKKKKKNWLPVTENNKRARRVYPQTENPGPPPATSGGAGERRPAF